MAKSKGAAEDDVVTISSSRVCRVSALSFSGRFSRTWAMPSETEVVTSAVAGSGMSSTLGAVHRPAVMMGDVIPAPPRFRFHGEWLLERPRDDLHAQLLDLEHYVDWWHEVRAVARLRSE